MVVGCWCCAGDGDGVSVRLVDLRWLLGFWWMLLADFVGPAAVRSSVRLVVVVDVVGPAAVRSSVRLVVVVDVVGPAAVRSSVRLVVVDVVWPAAVRSSVRLVVVVDFLVMWMCISSSLMLW